MSDAALRALHGEGKLLEGEFRPGGTHIEWCDPEILQQVRRRTLARLRREVVPAEQYVFARLLARWQGVPAPRAGTSMRCSIPSRICRAAEPIAVRPGA